MSRIASTVGSILLMCACAGVGAAEEQGSGILTVKGLLSPESVDEVIRKIDRNTTAVHITSEGGDAIAAIKLADAIRSGHLDVRVEGYCYSSCANYVFLAARNKVLAPGAVLGFHGAPYSLLSPAEKEKISQGEALQNNGHLSGLKEIARQDYLFQKRTGLGDCVFERVRSVFSEYGKENPEPSGKMVGELSYSYNGNAYSASGDDFEAALERLLVLLKSDPSIKYTASFQAGRQRQPIVYFPGLSALTRCGITGLKEYSYPKTLDELVQIQKRLGHEKITILNDIE
jgi:hypothetical protein